MKKVVIELSFFALIVGSFATFAQKYIYGSDIHVEHIPLIIREIDPDYLKNDFFINLTSSFGPRVYYSKLLSLIGRPDYLPVLFLGFTYLSNVLIAAITAFFTYDLVKSKNAAILSVAMVMSLDYFQMSGNTTLYQNNLSPQLLATPLILAALWRTFDGRVFLPALLISISILIHPSIGIVGAFLYLLLIIKLVFFNSFSWKKLIFPCTLVLLAALAWMFPSSQFPKSEEGLRILIFERSPHHYLPKTWDKMLYLEFLGFLTATVVSLKELPRYFPKLNKSMLSGAVLVILVILMLGLSAIFLSDIIAIRFWANIQSLRQLYLVKWFGLIFIACFISGLLNGVLKKKLWGVIFLLSALNQIALGLIFLVYFLKKYARS